MDPSPLQLERYFTSSLLVGMRKEILGSVVDGNIGDGDEAFISAQKTFRSHDTEPSYWLSLSLDIKWPEAVDTRFEQISIQVEGFFSLAREDSKIKQNLLLLCLTNLLGIARTTVAQATAMCPGGAFLIPLFNIQKLLGDSQEEEMETKTPEHPKVKTRTKAKNK